MKQSKNAAMMLAMVVAWSVFYTVSKVTVDATGSVFAAGFLLRVAALIFLTVQLLVDGNFKLLFHPGKAAWILVLIGVFGFLLDLFANLGYAGGSLSTGTALLKTDVLMVNLITVLVCRKKLYGTDWLGTAVMLVGVLLVLGIDFSGFSLHLTDLFFLVSALIGAVFLHERLLSDQGRAGQVRQDHRRDLLLQQLCRSDPLWSVHPAPGRPERPERQSRLRLLAAGTAGRFRPGRYLFLLLPESETKRGLGGQALAARHADRQLSGRRGSRSGRSWESRSSCSARGSSSYAAD